jgi:CMP-N-acetylneuraminic acid synthetase
MKADIFKKLIKEAVREAIQEEMKDLLLEAVRSNKQPIRESFDSETRTLNFNTNSLPPRSPIDTKKAYMDILGEMA